ncbi:MAG: polysaccharide deacetylase family protein [Phycisphaerales bacterium JB041]
MTLAAGAWFAPPLIHRGVQVQALRVSARRHRRIALTFDDGPGPELTPRLLGLLAQHQAPATFFLLGRRVEKEPGIAQEVLRSGHEVGLHSFDHLHAWKVSPWRSVRDLRDIRWAHAALGHAPSLLRPPYGKMTLATWLFALARRARVAWWTFDTQDTRSETRDPDLVARELVRRGGGVVLLHDFDRDGRTDLDERGVYVLAVTRAILERGREAGFTFCRYSEFTANHVGARES